MRRLIAIPLLLWLAGCADLGYYWHNASGHLAIVRQRVDISDLLADPQTDATLRERLLLAQEIRRFSIERLALPDNNSYLAYVALDRPWAVQNLFAAPEFSTRLRQWCYPVVGCAAYRGYFATEPLQQYVAGLEAEGFDVATGQVAAYSTLGWFEDPLLSTFIHWPDHRLAGLIFHELTHQRIFIDDDTRFNESLASAVEQVGAELWLLARGQGDRVERVERRQRYRAEVVALVEATRARLDRLYAGEQDPADKRLAKAAILGEARDRHAQIAATHGINGGYTRWFGEGLNNARLGSLSAYRADAPAFVNLIRAHRLDFYAFFDHVARLGELDRPAREACLAGWAEGRPAQHCPPLSAQD